MSDKNTIGIYRINLDHQELLGIAEMTAKIEKIVQLHEAKKRLAIRDFEYIPMILSAEVEVPEGYSILAYRYERSNPNAWQSFLTSSFVNIPPLVNRNHDFLVFVYTNDSLFCFTGGSANHAITDFIDIGFPLDVMKRIVDPEKIKEAKSRSVTGEYYAREHLYRGYSTISATESFGQVWNDLSASIKESVWDDEDLALMLGPKKRINVEVKNFFKLKKSVDFSTIVKLIVRLKTLVDEAISAEVEETFAFLDSVSLVKGHTTQEALISVLKTRLYSYVTTGEELDFDFCNVNYDDYLDATEYMLLYKAYGVHSFTTYPTAEEVMDKVKEYLEREHPEDLADINTFSESIDAFRMETAQDEPFHQTAGTIVQHIHGEVEYDNKTYFLVDRNWYCVKDNFIELLKVDFRNFTGADRFIERGSIELESWGTQREGVFNDSYFTNPNFIVGDRVILNGIESFDLLYTGEDENLFIIHVKRGFGGKARESCSQIRNSAKMIESAVKSEQGKKLKELYGKLRAQPTDTGEDRTHGLTEAQFVALFDRKRVYVLALGNVSTPLALQRTRSNIAKFEVLTTRDTFRTYDVEGGLKICLLV